MLNEIAQAAAYALKLLQQPYFFIRLGHDCGPNLCPKHPIIWVGVGLN